MPIKAALVAAVIVMATGPLAAQEPLSAIEWLRRNPPAASGATRFDTALTPPPRVDPLAGPSSAPFDPQTAPEPPVTGAVTAPPITVTALDAPPLPVGLVPTTVTGLPPTLWQASRSRTLVRLLTQAPVQHSPAMQSVLYTLLLAEANPPGQSDPSAPDLTLAMIDRLMDLGAVEPAEALARRAGPTRSAALFRRWFDTTLLTGDEATACATLAAHPYLAPDYTSRIYCSARSGDWPAAALMLETADVLGELPQDRAQLLSRFLLADLDDGLLPPPQPIQIDPLAFRLYEAIGERLPSQSLPRAFAHADLRDISGWKAQLEAAERLARTGALSPNRFLGLYTERQAAASGGVWDRVRAVQAFEAALDAKDTAALDETLAPAWDAMRAAGTEVTFATLFADRLTALPSDTAATQELAWRIRLLSDQYERAARDAPDGVDATFLAATATGTPTASDDDPDLRRAIAAGFAPDHPLPRLMQDLLARDALGEVILRAIALFQRGTDGNPAALSDALATFRAVGLNDTARRAALQVMLLEPRR